MPLTATHTITVT